MEVGASEVESLPASSASSGRAFYVRGVERLALWFFLFLTVASCFSENVSPSNTSNFGASRTNGFLLVDLWTQSAFASPRLEPLCVSRNRSSSFSSSYSSSSSLSSTASSDPKGLCSPRQETESAPESVEPSIPFSGSERGGASFFSPVYRQPPPSSWQQGPRSDEVSRPRQLVPPHSSLSSSLSSSSSSAPRRTGSPLPVSNGDRTFRMPPVADVLLPHRRRPFATRNKNAEAARVLRELMDHRGDMQSLLLLLRRAISDKALSHLHYPTFPIDLRPWLLEEEQKVRRQADDLLSALRCLENASPAKDTGGTAAESAESGFRFSSKQKLRDAYVETMRQLQYLREMGYRHQSYSEEHRPPPEVLEFIERASRGAEEELNSGAFNDDPSAFQFFREVISSRDGMAHSYARPTTMRVTKQDLLDYQRAYEASVFRCALKPLAINSESLSALTSFGVRPSLLLGKGFGLMVKRRTLGLSYNLRDWQDPPRRNATEMEQLLVPHSSLQCPSVPSLEKDSPADTAKRRLLAAQQRVLGFTNESGGLESPLSFFARVMRVVQDQRVRDSDQAQSTDFLKLPPGPASTAASHFLLIQKAKELALPSSAIALLQKFAHLLPEQIQISSETKELFLTALRDFEKFLFKHGQFAAQKLVPLSVKLDQRRLREKCKGRVFARLDTFIDVPTEVLRSVEGLAEDWKEDERRFNNQVANLAMAFARRKLEFLDSLRKFPLKQGAAVAKEEARRRQLSSSSSLVSLPSRVVPGRLTKRQERQVLAEAEREATEMMIVERAIENADFLGLEDTELKSAMDRVAPLTEQLRKVVAERKRPHEELLNLREARVRAFLDETAKVAEQNAIKKMGIENARRFLKGRPVIPGLLLHGRVNAASHDVVSLDVGLDVDAQLYEEDVFLPLEVRPPEGLRRYFRVGSPCSAIVSSTRPTELRVTILPLREIAAWESLSRATSNTQLFAATAISASPGGLVVKVNGVKGFLPTSHITDPSLHPLSLMQNSSSTLPRVLVVRILLADVRQNRLLVSQRLAFANRLVKQEGITTGSLFEGVVKEVLPFGVTVDSGLLRGLLHVREISSLRVNPASIFRPGERIRAVVLTHNPATGRILLSTRRLEAFPGQILADSQGVFNRAEMAARTFKEECNNQQEEQKSAAAQFLKTLGRSASEDWVTQKAPDTDGEDVSWKTELLEPPQSLWFGLDTSTSPLMRYLASQLKDAEEREAQETDEAEQRRNASSAQAHSNSLDSPLPPLRLPGGGFVRIRRQAPSVSKETAREVAAALASLKSLQDAIVASGLGDGPRRSLLSISEGPLENEEWIFS